MGLSLGQRYHQALEQLLPQGWAWQRRGCDESLLGRVLRANSEELARFHIWLELQIKQSIERFGDVPQGWSAPDYERLLLNKFGIEAVVTDGLKPVTCESACSAPLLDERIVYVYVITVDDVNAIPDAVKTYLKTYQQSHTHFHFRDRFYQSATKTIPATHLGTESISVVLDLAGTGAASTCEAALYEQHWYEEKVNVQEGAHCGQALYEQDFVMGEIIADWSYTDAEKRGLLRA